MSKQHDVMQWYSDVVEAPFTDDDLETEIIGRRPNSLRPRGSERILSLEELSLKNI